jgi:hypothetical protein
LTRPQVEEFEVAIRAIVREQLMEMIEKRISDASILKLLRKWINVGVVDEGKLLLAAIELIQRKFSALTTNDTIASHKLHRPHSRRKLDFDHDSSRDHV